MSLVGWWTLNGDATDRLGEYDGYPVNASYGGGKLGDAYDNTANNNSGVELIRHDDFTEYGDYYSFSLWFKSTTTSGNGGERIISRDHSEYATVLIDQSQTSPQSTNNRGLPNFSATVNEWHHLAFSVDVGAGEARLFLDGNLVGTSSTYDSTSARPYVIGGNTEGDGDISGGHFVGKIDDVRLYDHVLSEKEVAQLSRGKLLHYKFNGVSDPNSLHNATFEAGTPGSTDPPGWTYNVGAWHLNSDHTRPGTDGSQAFGSSYGGDSSNFDTGTATDAYPTAVAYQDVSVSGEEPIDAEAWVYSDGGTAQADGNSCSSGQEYVLEDDGRLHLKALDDSGAVLGETSTAWGGEQGYDGYEWQHHTISGWVPPDGTKKVRFQIDGGDGNDSCIDPDTGHSGNAGIWIDDCVLTENPDAQDATGRGNDGTLNGPTFSTASVIGSGAYDFTQSNSEYIRPERNTPSGDPEVTLSVWAKANSVPQTEYTGILSLGTDQSTNTTFTINTEGNGKNVAVHTWSNSTPLFALDTNWHHYVGVNTGSGEQRFYVDGELIGSMNQSLNIPDEQGAVGARVYSIEGNNNRWWDGQIADARIYTTELSDSEIQSLYEQRASIDAGGTTYGHEIEETNTIDGGSFEKDSNGATQSQSDNFDLRKSAQVKSSESNTGAKSLRGVAVGDSSWQSIFYLLDAEGGPLMKEGETWTFSFYAKSNNSFNYSVGFAGGGGFLKTSIESNSDWTYYEVTDTVSSSSQNKFQCRDNEADGEIYFDDFTATKGQEATPRNITIEGVFSAAKINEIGPAPESLVGWWPLDGNTKDFSGNNNDGVNYNAIVTGGLGQSAYKFDASTTRIDAPLSTLSVPFCIFAWIKPNTSLSAWDSSPSRRAFLDSSTFELDQKVNNNCAYIVKGVGSVGDVNDNTYSYPEDQWSFAGLWYDGNTMKMYRNTSVIDQISTSGGISGQSNVTIGRNAGDNDRNWGGKIQNVRIYNRALSDAEVAQLYAITDPRTTKQMSQTQDGRVLAKNEFSELI